MSCMGCQGDSLGDPKGTRREEIDYLCPPIYSKAHNWILTLKGWYLQRVPYLQSSDQCVWFVLDWDMGPVLYCIWVFIKSLIFWLEMYRYAENYKEKEKLHHRYWAYMGVLTSYYRGHLPNSEFYVEGSCRYKAAHCAGWGFKFQQHVSIVSRSMLAEQDHVLCCALIVEWIREWYFRSTFTCLEPLYFQYKS